MEYNWGAISMGRVLSVLEVLLSKIEADTYLRYNKVFLRNISRILSKNFLYWKNTWNMNLKSER